MSLSTPSKSNGSEGGTVPKILVMDCKHNLKEALTPVTATNFFDCQPFFWFLFLGPDRIKGNRDLSVNATYVRRQCVAQGICDERMTWSLKSAGSIGRYPNGKNVGCTSSLKSLDSQHLTTCCRRQTDFPSRQVGKRVAALSGMERNTMRPYCFHSCGSRSLVEHPVAI